MKKAIVVVSFGTAVKEARKAIENMENVIKKSFSDFDFFRAFTSSVVIKKIKREENVEILNLEQAFEYLKENKYDEVYCQSIHILNGLEYFKAVDTIEKYKKYFKKLVVGKPLLNDEDDYFKCFEILRNFMPKMNENEAFVYMGHGSEHFSNSAYSQLENTFHYNGIENVFVGTVEGFPNVLHIVERLKAKNIKKVYLMPFMIVCGDHAINDLAGDEENSWKTIFNKNGFETEIIFKSLGDFDEIGEIFVEHICS